MEDKSLYKKRNMNETKYEIQDIMVDGNVFRFVKKKRPEKLHDLFERTGMLDLEIGD